MRLVAACLVSFLVVYSVQPAMLPVPTGALVAALGLAILLVGVSLRAGHMRMEPSWAIPAAVAGLYVAWILLRASVSMPLDLFLAKSTVMFMVTALPAAFVADRVSGRASSGVPRAATYLYLVFVLQAVVVLVTFVSPAVRLALVSLIPPTGNLDVMHGVRMRGFSHAGGSFVSAGQAVGLLLGVHLFTNGTALTVARSAGVALGMLVILLSVLLTGRTGFIILPLLLVHGAWRPLLRGRLRLRRGVWIGVLLVVAMAGVGAWRAGEALRLTVRPVYNRAIAEMQVDESGRLRSRTLDVLLGRMWFAPEGGWTAAVGDPATWQERRIASDVGVIRRLHAVGVIGLGLTFAMILALGWPAMRCSTTPTDRRLIVLLVLWAMLLEFKEPLALTSAVGMPLVILSVAASRAALAERDAGRVAWAAHG